MNTIRNLLAALLLGGIACQAHGYTTWECLDVTLDWSTNSVTLRYASASFPAGVWRTALDTAIDRVNQNPSPFRFSKSYNDGAQALDNGENEAWFSDAPDLLNGSPAITYTQYDCIDYWIFGKDVEITETDVIFDSDENFTTSMTRGDLIEYGGALRPFQTTAIHELGHALGLAHTNNTYNIMGWDWQHIHVNGTTARSYLGEDAANGTVFLYGTTNGAAEDLGVVHWKYRDASGEYSRHRKTRVTDNNGGALDTFTVNGETGYEVSRGQTVKLELTYENNGKTHQPGADARLYVSTNDTISTADTELARDAIDINRNTVYTKSTSVVIPNNLTVGRVYYLGAVIDADGSLAEMTESNNATYLPIRIE
jgi:hypothetical protein